LGNDGNFTSLDGLFGELEIQGGRLIDFNADFNLAYAAVSNERSRDFVGSGRNTKDKIFSVCVGRRTK